MKLLLNKNRGKEIEVGDIVEDSDYGVCLLTYECSSANEEYPYKLVGLQSGKILSAYSKIGFIRETCVLLIKNGSLVVSDYEVLVD